MLSKLIAAFVILSTTSLSIPLAVFAQSSSGTPYTDKCVEVFLKTKSDMESNTITPSQKVTTDSTAIKVWGEEVHTLQMRRIVPYGSADPSGR
ncbi:MULTISPECIES: hypothetical protein [Pseudanabaena]|uniref:Uncharacterized protein n=2 Tax=Pseudanabaena TaxID=1152 RepID=L8N6S3_9CYAN|nr:MULTISPECIES: hypothetical protein [Pseudanabaena]ELS34799.1 hypothetical protein Pse7429DRAFT_0106 [Pseudanabaena biceps PCC 7429]MDG3493036.1 hypothetical protein [Pseudanabaena catenata USMAC16]